MKWPIPLALPLLLATCPSLASGLAAPAASPATSDPAVDEVESQLVRYHWRLQNATNAKGRRIKALFVRPDKPLQLDFDDKWYWVRNSCNYMSSDYTLQGEFLIEGDGGSETVAACIPRIQALDTEIGKRLGRKMRYALASGDPPVLKLVNRDGGKLVFVGTLIGERLTIEVAARTKPCDPASTTGTQCLQAREVKYDDSDGSFDADGPFESLASEIEGFEHENGVRYVLGVERFAIDKPSADGPSYRYVLEWTFVTDATGK